MRRGLLYLSRAGWARRAVTRRQLPRLAASRFVAGDTLDEALKVVESLNEKGLLATLDHLGEDVTTLHEAEAACATYLQLLDAIHAARLRANVSLKLSQLGLRLDAAACKANMQIIASRAAELQTFVRIDMEDSTLVDGTFETFEALSVEDRSHVGLVIQAYLYRSQADLDRALTAGARIRLVKGAYNEPPSLAFPRKADVDQNFDRLTVTLLKASASAAGEPAGLDGRRPPLAAIATHDPERISFARSQRDILGLRHSDVEFQMLYGIASELQLSLSSAGYPVRVYVPYGTEWYPYFMRRLAERPANLWFFLSHLLRG